MSDEAQNTTPDAARRLLSAIQTLYADHQRHAAELGKLCFQLRNLYSERANSSGSRTSPGHGIYCAELKKLGIPRQRAAEWVRDHEVKVGLRKPAESTVAKQKARRQRERQVCSDPVSSFAALLPFEALQSAYRVAAKLFHPDLGGDSEQMKRLNAVWKQAEEHFKSVGETVNDSTVRQ